MELYDVVMKLNGPITPLGDSSADGARLDNLKDLCSLVDALVSAIDEVAMETGDHMASVKTAKDCAADFLTNTLGIKE